MPSEQKMFYWKHSLKLHFICRTNVHFTIKNYFSIEVPSDQNVKSVQITCISFIQYRDLWSRLVTDLYWPHLGTATRNKRILIITIVIIMGVNILSISSLYQYDEAMQRDIWSCGFKFSPQENEEHPLFCFDYFRTATQSNLEFRSSSFLALDGSKNTCLYYTQCQPASSYNIKLTDT